MNENTENAVNTVKKKRSKKKIIIIVVIVVILVLLITSFIRCASAVNDAMMDAMVQSSEAYTGDISSTVTGSGTLAAASTTNVNIPSGVVIDTVLVRNGEVVTEGENLASVDVASAASALLTVRENISTVTSLKNSLGNVSDTTSDNYLRSLVYQDTLDQLNELKGTLETMVSTGYLTAPCDGIISGVNVSDGGTAGSSSSSLASQSSEDSADMYQSGYAEGGEDMLCLLEGDTAITNITIGSDSIMPVRGGTPVTNIDCDAYSGIISWDPQTTQFAAGTQYTATIVLSPKTGYSFSNDLQTVEDALNIEGAEDTAIRLGTIGDTPAVLIVAQFPATAADPTQPTEAETTAADAGNQPSAEELIDQQAAEAGLDNVDLSAFSADAGGSSSYSGGSSASAYTVATTPAFVIASNDQVTVNISVNELDILSVEQGQTATVTIDALEGEEFEGTLTRISSTTSGTNGNVAYTAEITIDKTDEMRIGMSASATVVIGNASDALLIPSAAIQEDGERVFVYTGVDSDGLPTNEVEVETGISDGSEVQILSGLSEGDTVYYTQTDSDIYGDMYFEEEVY